MQLTQLFDIPAQTGQLNELLKNTKGDPEAFYAAGGRNIFFRLETLARIGGGLGDKDNFEDALRLFKASEDLLGKYDFFAAYLGLFNENKDCRRAFLEIFGDQLQESKAALSENLKKWSGKAAVETTKDFLQRCDEIRFDDEASFIKSFCKFIIKALEKIIRNYNEGDFDTSDVEAGLHELRRKLRWISLYIQASRGIIRHQPSKLPEKKFASYTTKETMASPFMKLPVHPSIDHPVMLRTETYAALSWMIATLGKYKDHALTTSLFSHHHELSSCYRLTTLEEMNEDDVLRKVKTLSRRFFAEDGILEELISDLKAYT